MPAVDLTDKYTKQKWYNDEGEINPNFAMLTQEIANYKFFVLQGASRSGKTWAVIYWIWQHIYNYSGLRIGVCRATIPDVINSVLKDFIEVGLQLGLYDEKKMNKTRNIYTFNGNEVEFFALDEEGKARGRKRDIIYINEGNQIHWDLVSQIVVRTNKKVIIDFNPSDLDSWIYDKVLIRDNACFLKTTYKHNPFLTEEQLEEFEFMRIHEPDKYLWQGLGERAIRQGQIYSGWQEISDEDYIFDKCDVWAIDFGTTVDPTTINRAKFEGRNIYAQNLVYQSNLRSFQILIHLFFLGYNEDRHVLIGDGGGVGATFIAEMRGQSEYTMKFIKDEAEKLGYTFINKEHEFRLLEFVNNGTFIHKAIKPKGSVIGGIDMVKTYRVYLDKKSSHAWEEYFKYAWKVDKHTNKILNVPLDMDNHFMDALRYMVMAKGRYHTAL